MHSNDILSIGSARWVAKEALRGADFTTGVCNAHANTFSLHNLLWHLLASKSAAEMAYEGRLEKYMADRGFGFISSDG